MQLLETAHRDCHITDREYYYRCDTLNARLNDLHRAQNHQQMQAAYQQQQMLVQQQFAQQAILQGQSQALAQSGAAALFPAIGGAGMQAWPPVTPLETEDVFGEVVAWRCWRSPMLPILTSCHMTHIVWMPKQIEEAKGVCDYNQCGFHAWKDERQATEYGMTLALPLLIGRVRLWGDVIHHERGYRAQFAKIASLDTLVTHVAQGPNDRRDTGPWLKSLQRRYGVEVAAK